MEARLNPYRTAPDAINALITLERYVEASGLEKALLNLIKTRASQVNSCAFCIDMHTHDARLRGETEERLYQLDAWRESPLYSARERAALAWTEAVTLVATTHVPDAVYDEAHKQFSEDELVKLTVAIAAINAWNRMGISFRAVPAARKTRAA
jgi:AhpD family alkylhydroperoxidase